MRLFIGALFSAAFVLTGTAGAQSVSPPPEVRRLQFYVGRWDERGRMRDDPAKAFQPIAGGETCRWAAGGYAVVCEEATSGRGGGWQGAYILSYDSATKQYHVYGTEAPGSNMHAVGRVEGERWVWTTDPAPDGTQVRYVFAPAGASARTLGVELRSAGRWSSIVEIRYTRKR